MSNLSQHAVTAHAMTFFNFITSEAENNRWGCLRVTSFIGESYRNDIRYHEIPGVHCTASNQLLPLVSV